jgi:hypothetical protein
MAGGKRGDGIARRRAFFRAPVGTLFATREPKLTGRVNSGHGADRA